MSVMLTAAEPVTRAWNLVDWIALQFQFNENQHLILHLLGALLCIVIPYLLGSINPAILISGRVYHDDIRRHGSGNAGSTNMLRTYGKKAAAATFVLDMLKAALAVILGKLIWETNGGAIASFFVMFGHMFPIFSQFRGGKGVACLAMTIGLISPITCLFLAFVFFVSLIGTRMVSFASIMCAFFYPLVLRAFANRGLNVAMAVISSVFVVLMHRENIKRIMKGEEPKLDFSKLKRSKKKSDGGDAQ